jgi:GTP cyclohydrolase IV
MATGQEVDAAALAAPEGRVLPTFRPVEPWEVEHPADFLNRETDVPSSAPKHPIAVERAGVCDCTVALEIDDFVNPSQALRLAGKVSAGVCLPPEQRGVHMSRIVEAIATASAGRPWNCVSDFMATLVESIVDGQELRKGYAELSAETIIRRTTPVSGRSSPDTVGILARSSMTDGRIDTVIGLRVNVMTACPCTQAYSTYSSVLELSHDFGLETANEIGERLVTFTHSQRGLLTIETEVVEGGIRLPQLFAAASDGAHVVHSVLKRPDEHFLVRKAHERPQFTEDVTREVATALISATPAGPADNAQVTVVCRNYESIHPHDVESRVSGSIGGFREVLHGAALET